MGRDTSTIEITAEQAERFLETVGDGNALHRPAILRDINPDYAAILPGALSEAIALNHSGEEIPTSMTFAFDKPIPMRPNGDSTYKTRPLEVSVAYEEEKATPQIAFLRKGNPENHFAPDTHIRFSQQNGQEAYHAEGQGIHVPLEQFDTYLNVLEEILGKEPSREHNWGLFAANNVARLLTAYLLQPEQAGDYTKMFEQLRDATGFEERNIQGQDVLFPAKRMPAYTKHELSIYHPDEPATLELHLTGASQGTKEYTFSIAGSNHENGTKLFELTASLVPLPTAILKRI